MLLKTEFKIQCCIRSYSFRLSFAVLQAGAMNGKQSHSEFYLFYEEYIVRLSLMGYSTSNLVGLWEPAASVTTVQLNCSGIMVPIYQPT